VPPILTAQRRQTRRIIELLLSQDSDTRWIGSLSVRCR
jgi:hypothetical protein